MGRENATPAGLAGALFSHVQLRVLSLLLGHPDEKFHTSEIIRIAGSGSGAVQRELQKLSGAGILIASSLGNRKIYQANRASPIFEELHGLLMKTVGLLEPLRRALASHSADIDVAFVYGSVAKGQDTAGSDIDLMIIGSELAYGEVYGALHEAEKVLRRAVNPTLMTATEWKRKVVEKSAFVGKVVRQPKLFVFGTENELQRIG